MAEEPDNLVLEILRRMQGDMSQLKGDVAGLKSDVAELKSDVMELKTDMRRVELKTDANTRAIDDLRYLMRGFWETEEKQEARLASLERRVNALERRPSDH